MNANTRLSGPQLEPSPARSRALRATRAVTFGGLSLTAAACGTTPATLPTGDVGADTGSDTGTDAPTDTVTPDVIVVPDVRVDTAPTCSGESDDVCPDSCNPDTDIDCCEGDQAEWEWCTYDSEWGCQCAAEGPFAPPSFRSAA